MENENHPLIIDILVYIMYIYKQNRHPVTRFSERMCLVKRLSGVKGGAAVIMSYPFTQVREKLLAGAKISPGLVDQAIIEFQKYLLLIARGYKSVAMVSREVDEVWHTFILFTKDYAWFCEEAFGFFLHHQPSLPSYPIDAAARQRFVTAYRQEFGDLPTIWSTGPTDGCCGEECSPEPSCSSEPDPTGVPRGGLVLY